MDEALNIIATKRQPIGLSVPVEIIASELLALHCSRNPTFPSFSRLKDLNFERYCLRAVAWYGCATSGSWTSIDGALHAIATEYSP